MIYYIKDWMRDFKVTRGLKKFFRRASLVGTAALGIAGAIGGVAKLTAPLWATDEAGAIVAIKGRDLRPVRVGGYGFFSCGFFELYATKYSAENLNGKMVMGVVCKTPFSEGLAVRVNG